MPLIPFFLHRRKRERREISSKSTSINQSIHFISLQPPPSIFYPTFVIAIPIPMLLFPLK